MKQNENKHLKSSDGFTIVELLVAMAVFVFILVAAIGIFLNSLKNQRFLAELVSINNNAGVVLEQMMREMRTGYFDDTNGAPVLLGSCKNSIAFFSGADISSGPQKVTYSLKDGGIFRAVGDSDPVAITADNVDVANLCFATNRYSQTGKAECYPPRVTILMEVKSKNLEAESADSPSSFLQTTVSPRILPREIENDPYKCNEI